MDPVPTVPAGDLDGPGGFRNHHPQAAANQDGVAEETDHTDEEQGDESNHGRVPYKVAWTQRTRKR